MAITVALHVSKYTDMKQTFLSLLIFSWGLSVTAQFKSDPIFKGTSIDTISSSNLQDLISKYFRSSFFSYFDTACGQYYDLYDFKVSKSGKIEDFSFGRPT